MIRSSDLINWTNFLLVEFDYCYYLFNRILGYWLRALLLGLFHITIERLKCSTAISGLDGMDGIGFKISGGTDSKSTALRGAYKQTSTTCPGPGFKINCHTNCSISPFYSCPKENLVKWEGFFLKQKWTEMNLVELDTLDVIVTVVLQSFLHGLYGVDLIYGVWKKTPLTTTKKI